MEYRPWQLIRQSFITEGENKKKLSPLSFFSKQECRKCNNKSIGNSFNQTFKHRLQEHSEKNPPAYKRMKSVQRNCVYCIYSVQLGHSVMAWNMLFKLLLTDVYCMFGLAPLPFWLKSIFCSLFIPLRNVKPYSSIF